MATRGRDQDNTPSDDPPGSTWSGTKEDYREDPDVSGLVDWLAAACRLLPGIPGSPWAWSMHGTPSMPWPICDLVIPTSRFVSQWVSGRFFGFDHVVPNYRWKSSWSPPSKVGVPTPPVASEDWTGTWHSLKRLSGLLQGEIFASPSNSASTLYACHQVLNWGGDRNPKVGAEPFLDSLHHAGTLINYLKTCEADSRLATASLPLSSFELTNSMMSKVYAFAARDGLPIYDSRVAAASASLVELYRLHTGQLWVAVPPSVAFPATDPALRRTVQRLHPGAISPGKFNYATRRPTANRWASSAVRLGWLMQLILTRLGVKTHHLVDAMRWLEGGLFMMGYDVACLRPNLPPSTVTVTHPMPTPSGKITTSPRIKSLSTAKLKARKTMEKSAQLLGPKPKSFRYSGSFQYGLRIEFGNGVELVVPPEMLIALSDTFQEQIVALGADRTNTPEGSIGAWLSRRSQEFGITLNSQHAARLTAVLKEEGIVDVVPSDALHGRGIRGRRPIRVRFIGDD